MGHLTVGPTSIAENQAAASRIYPFPPASCSPLNWCGTASWQLLALDGRIPVTAHPTEDIGHLSTRNLAGKYLVRSFDASGLPEVRSFLKVVRIRATSSTAIEQAGHRW